MFSLLNWEGCGRGQVPNPGYHTWHGRRFSHWKEETTLFVGNPLFFSVMDALIAASFSQLTWNDAHIIRALLAVLIGSVVTFFWFRNATRDYESGKITSWGWQWCKSRTISIAGKYHTVYFWLHACIITYSLTSFVWQSQIIIHIRMGVIYAIVGYAVTFLHFLYMQRSMDEVYDSKH